MSKDDTTNAMRLLGRRGLASRSAVSLALASGVAMAKAPVPNPDAELIGLCVEVIAINREYLAINRRGLAFAWNDPEAKVSHKAAGTLVPPMHALRERVAALPACTPEGIEAKARVAWYWLLDDADDESAGLLRDDDALALSLVRDLLSRFEPTS